MLRAAARPSDAARTGSAPKSGSPPRTVSAILRRHQVPYLRECDPLTGEVIRASQDHRGPLRTRPHPATWSTSTSRRSAASPTAAAGEPTGRSGKRQSDATSATRIGYDYVHVAVDDHSRLAYAEILPDEKGPTCAAFLLRAARLPQPRHRRCARSSPTTPATTTAPTTSKQHRTPSAHAIYHQTPLPVAERQGRKVQPHHPDRMGLPPGLHHQRPNEQKPLIPGSTTTTLNDATQPSEASPRSAARAGDRPGPAGRDRPAGPSRG